MDLYHLRRSYVQAGFDQSHAHASPIEQLRIWLREAIETAPEEWFECTAMTLATAAPEVSARIVLLKAIEETGLLFFTNYLSDKARQLDESPQAAVCIYWPHVERQVRVEGTVEKTSAELSDKYFAERPRGSQLGAHASPQSQPIPSREFLEHTVADLEAQYADQPIPRPAHWGGYRLVPHRFEFWQGRENRLHDRVLYSLHGTTWTITRLAP